MKSYNKIMGFVGGICFVVWLVLIMFHVIEITHVVNYYGILFLSLIVLGKEWKK